MKKMQQISKIAIAFVGVLAITFSIYGHSAVVDIQGTVNDTTGKAVSGATVSLAKIKNLTTTTGADGTFRLQQNTGIIPNNSVIDLNAELSLNKNFLVFNQKTAGNVALTVYDMKGVMVATLFKGSLSSGSHLFTMPENLATAMHIIGVTRNNVTKYIKSDNLTSFSQNIPGNEMNNSLAQAQVYGAYFAVDTIIIKKTGFVDIKIPVDSLIIKTGVVKLKAVSIKYPIVSGSCGPCGRLSSCVSSCPHGAITNNGRAVYNKAKCKGVTDPTCKGRCTSIVCYLRKPAFVEAIISYFDK
ncbi:MAG: hypothetical protein JW795_15980 [Chitinivibrionales bacterium]|nr:hypothetical protein [Chitinivibrionales bacterium]